MQRIEYKTKDKTNWPSGEWMEEPDKIQWLDEATGTPCLIVRNNMGALCGYVGVSSFHPLYKKEYDSMVFPDFDVHGGITFSDTCSQNPDGICHKVEPGEDDNIWWVGFDCGHLGDFAPNILHPLYTYIKTFNLYDFSEREEKYHNKEEYRNISYVTQEVKKLAKQLKEYA